MARHPVIRNGYFHLCDKGCYIQVPSVRCQHTVRRSLRRRYVNVTNTNFSFVTQTFHCDGSGEVPLYVNLPINRTKVCASVDLIIPANSQLVIGACVAESIPDGQNGVIIPNHWLGPRSDIVCANVLATKRRDMVPVLLLNPTGQSKTLQKGTTVAYFQIVTDDIEATHLGHLTETATAQTAAISGVESAPTASPQEDPPHVDLSGADLSKSEKDQLWQLLLRYRKVFANDITELGSANTPEHVISVGDAPPVRSMPYRIPPKRREIIRAEIEQLLENGIIEPSNSPWASPIILLFKKSGEPRCVVDFRKVNAVTRPDAYPIPVIW